MKKIYKGILLVVFVIIVAAITWTLLINNALVSKNWYQKDLYFDKITEQYTGKNVSVAIVSSGVSDEATVDNLVTINNEGNTFIKGDIDAYLLNKLSPDTNVTMYDIVGENDVISDADYIQALEDIEKNEYEIVVLSFGSYEENKQIEKIINNIYNSGTILLGAVGDEDKSQIMYPAKYDSVIPICASMSQGVDYEDNNGYPSQCYYFPGANIKYNNELYSGSSYASVIAAAYVADYLEYDPQASQVDIIEMFEFIKGENNTGYHYVFDIEDRAGNIIYVLYNGFIPIALFVLSSRLKRYRDKYGKL